MTRIVIIGNSHVAALKVGWDEIAAEHPDLDVDFFTAPGRWFRRFRLSEGLRFGLTPEQVAQPDAILDPSGRAFIELSEADCVVWAGYHWPYDAVADLLCEYDVDGLRETKASQILSRPAFDAFCASIAEPLVPPPEWRDWRKPQLIVLPAPLRSEDCLKNRSGRFRRFHVLAGKSAGAREAFLAFWDDLAAVLARHGIGLVTQPPETMLPSGLTELRFTRGARRILVPDAESEDVTHMNGEYGKLQLRAIFARLAPPAALAPPLPAQAEAVAS